jgi:hypothetical protein
MMVVEIALRLLAMMTMMMGGPMNVQASVMACMKCLGNTRQSKQQLLQLGRVMKF